MSCVCRAAVQIMRERLEAARATTTTTTTGVHRHRLLDVLATNVLLSLTTIMCCVFPAPAPALRLTDRALDIQTRLFVRAGRSGQVSYDVV